MSLTENDPGLNPPCHRLVIHLLKRSDSIQYVRNEPPVMENSWNCCSSRLQLTANQCHAIDIKVAKNI